MSRHPHPVSVSRAGSIGLAVFVALLALPVATRPASALSEIKREDLPPPQQPTPADDTEKAVPMPDPIKPPAAATPVPATPGEAVPGSEPDGGQLANPPPQEDEPVPPVLYDIAQLPAEVQRLRTLILEACASGDIEKLRPLLGMGDDATQLSLAGVDGDPITYLKSLSGDEQGAEILAILEEVLSSGYVHLDVGTPQELYVWPYFFAVPLEKLTPQQKVELFKIVTAGDYEEMKSYGAYIFYRVGITPEGRWTFFVAGE